MTAWLTVVGVGATPQLGPAAQTFINAAQWVFGSERLLRAVEIPTQKRRPWPSPFSDGVDAVLSLRGADVVVLATGDPMYYGVGATLSARLPCEEMRVLPSPSAFSLAAARLGWPLRHVVQASFHGRSVDRLSALLQPHRRIIALTSNGATLNAVAKLLNRHGYGDSAITILENMGAPDERVTTVVANRVSANRLSGKAVSDLNTLAIICTADDTALLRSRVPGLPDAAYRHDGQLTKREIRALTLSALAPADGETLWDIGAGCGSIGIEWMRAADNAPGVAFERNGDRLAMIEENARALGAPSLEIVAGEAAASMPGRPAPDAIFIGGAVADDTVFEAAWSHLKDGGRLVANAVTLNGEAALGTRYRRYGGELVRCDISIAQAIGSMAAMSARRSVLQWRATKRRQKTAGERR
jgi:precorrin-6Y C5,15-methyltransferase (decarboxylating)